MEKRRRRYRPLTQEQGDRIMRRVEQGVPYQYIAESFDVLTSCVSNLVSRRRKREAKEEEACGD